MKILLVEDDEATAKILSEALTIHHYSVDLAVDGQIGLQLAQVYDYDLILLDVMIPKLDGIEVCRQLRASGSQSPILLLTVLDSSADQVIGLEAGADDYLSKPYHLPELMARIRALLRRRNSSLGAEGLTWEKLRLDLESSAVTYAEKLLHLTPKEYSILELFLRHPQRIFSRSAILDRIWSVGEFPGEEAVTTHIKGLRQKLKAAGMTIDLIETVYGLGYRLRTEPTKKTEEVQQPSDDAQSQAQAKVTAVVAEVWAKYKDSLIEKVNLFEQAIAQLAAGNLEPQLREQATAEAHRLAGSLGSFGLPEGSRIAQEIEQLLKTLSARFDSVERLGTLVGLLKQVLKQPPVTPGNAPVSPRAKLLVIDDDTVLTEQIKAEASTWELQVEVATNQTTATQAIAQNPPNIILLDLTFPDQENKLTLLAQLHHQKPEIPVLVFTEENSLSDASGELHLRLKVARLGAFAFLPKSISVAELLKAVTQALAQTHPVEAKVMVVDDDSYLLTTLTAILQPWGLQVTTLAQPQQFWEVLEAIHPDLLILDVEMPDFNGIELCQVVRNDYRTRQIPILFLSGHSDPETVHQVFAAGADDYVNKPIVEPELIARVLNRLERTQLRHKLSQTQDFRP